MSHRAEGSDGTKSSYSAVNGNRGHVTPRRLSSIGIKTDLIAQDDQKRR